jgi:hypothetical protein
LFLSFLSFFFSFFFFFFIRDRHVSVASGKHKTRSLIQYVQEWSTGISKNGTAAVCTLYCMYAWRNVVTVTMVSVIHSSVVQSWNLWSCSIVNRFEFRSHTRYLFMVLRYFPHYLQIMLGFRLKYPQLIVFSFRIVGLLAQQAMQHCLIKYKSIIYKFLVEILFVYAVL